MAKGNIWWTKYQRRGQWAVYCPDFPMHTCSCSEICLDVGRNAIVYQPMNSREGNTCLSRILAVSCRNWSGSWHRYVHWSRRDTRKLWSTDSPLFSTASSKVFTISTSRPFCVPRRAPSTVHWLCWARNGKKMYSVNTKGVLSIGL